MEEKKKCLDDIKKLSSITIKGICYELNINDKNFYNLRTSKAKTKLVRDTYIKKIKDALESIE